ncbi:MAG: hypothetical protein PHQ68_04530 [Parabacteroides sp.]|nr:hypothetical protein [Parabacteroides sp.]
MKQSIYRFRNSDWKYWTNRLNTILLPNSFTKRH